VKKHGGWHVQSDDVAPDLASMLSAESMSAFGHASWGRRCAERSARSPPLSPAIMRPPNAWNWFCPRPAFAIGPPRPMRVIAAVARHYGVLTPVAWPMQMPGSMARRGASPRRTRVNSISFEGRSVIVAMCVGQLGSLLPHVVVPSILAVRWRSIGPEP
jgi:hypothetical protein